jgi:hypothetical protein
LGGRIHTVKKNEEASGIARKETGLEVNSDKTRYMVTTQEIRMQEAVTIRV